MAKKRIERYEEGGVVGNGNYPFGQSQTTSSSAPTSTGLGNNSPLVQVNTPGAEVEEDSSPSKTLGMKRGGRVSANRRGDGIVQRGKTRGRII